MRRRFLSLILLCSVLLTSLLSAGSARAWVCDGRVCSTTTECCCVSPVQQDARCRVKPSGRGASVACKSGCACKLIIKAVAPRSASLPSPSVFAPIFALLPSLPAFSYAAPATLQAVLLPIAPRGPPARSVALVHPSLRAPPIA